MRKTIINLTPHNINLYKDGQLVETILASGVVARVSMTTEVIGTLNDFEVRRNAYSEVMNLPEKTENTVYIVSSLVAQAAKDRDDLVITDGAVRDTDGRIIGCTGFAVI